MQMKPLAVSIAEAVKLSDNSRTAIYQAIASGALVARKRGRRTLILYSDLEQWLAALPEAGK